MWTADKNEQHALEFIVAIFLRAQNIDRVHEMESGNGTALHSTAQPTISVLFIERLQTQ